jgi:hypothetical protein
MSDMHTRSEKKHFQSKTVDYYERRRGHKVDGSSAERSGKLELFARFAGAGFGLLCR